MCQKKNGKIPFQPWSGETFSNHETNAKQKQKQYIKENTVKFEYTMIKAFCIAKQPQSHHTKKASKQANI